MLRYFSLSLFCFTLAANAAEPLPAASLERTASTGSERKQVARNSGSPVFGANLFSSEQKEVIASAFNPSYVIQRGDHLRVQIWGALVFNDVLVVDAQGNVFIPEVGPVSVAGAKNQDLTEVLMAGIGQVYTQHINLYANLETSQEVKVYVAGYVQHPGLYAGHASDNLMNYLHLAGGIDLARGSFTAIEVKRGTTTRKMVNLYDFLTKGEIPGVQFADGDVIFVHPIHNTLKVEGLVNNPYQFEFNGNQLSGAQLRQLARPIETATTFTVQRSLGEKASALTFDIAQLSETTFQPGDELQFSADRQKASILVTIEGEHDGAGHLSLPYGATLGELYASLEFNDYSSAEQIQLFRKSTQQRQKTAILESLRRLENNVLSARSSTAEEAQLRLSEAELLLKFIASAKDVQPLVVLNHDNWREIRLEDSDRIIIPGSSQLVAVHGEVNFPNTQVFNDFDRVKDYVKRAGGFTQNSDKEKILILRQNGEMTMTEDKWIKFNNPALRAGDEIIVLPKVSRKYYPLVRDLSQIIYNIAIATKVVLDV
jgi:protein involved in polysaccharide export with SLBB domain